MPEVLLINSLTHNPWNNLALEDHLFEILVNRADSSSAQLGAILYLWQNDQTVVIGRNQNAWVECNTAQLEADGGFLARRTTGGGAVFHDLGNLCFSILLPQASFDVNRNFNFITKALIAEGIPAEKSGRNDILVDGQKFSGNAFRLNNGVGLHHGTFLVHSEFTRLARYLTVNPTKLQAKGIASVRSRVVNLITVKPDLTISALEASIQKAFLAEFCSEGDWTVIKQTDADYKNDKAFQERCARFASWDWRYGATIKFDAQVEHRFNWGQLQLGFSICRGRVETVQIWSDALDTDFIEAMEAALPGTPFHSAELAKAVANAVPDGDSPFGGCSRQEMAAELQTLLLEQGW